MDFNSSIKTYLEVGSYAFGRIIISAFMYIELYLVPTRFLILERDGLHKLFPNVGFEVAGHHVGGKHICSRIRGFTFNVVEGFEFAIICISRWCFINSCHFVG